MVKNPPANAGDMSLIPGLRRSPGPMTDNCYMKAPRTNSRIKDSNCAPAALPAAHAAPGLPGLGRDFVAWWAAGLGGQDSVHRQPVLLRYKACVGSLNYLGKKNSLRWCARGHSSARGRGRCTAQGLSVRDLLPLCSP